jgi:hypothetical protein
MKPQDVTIQSWGKASLAVVVVLSFVGVCNAAFAASGNNQLKPGEFVVDHPTLINLGFEWHIDGDDNRNSKVEVSYRAKGDATWKQAMPMLRLQGERIYQRDSWNVISPNMFAGSILDLQPGTEYEARFVMSDPDGITGQTAKTVTKIVTTRTRKEPMPYAGGRILHVYPPSYKGPRQEPSFDGIMCAYKTYCGGGDTTTTARPRVQPGDVILVHAGVYRNHPDYYGPDKLNNTTTPFEGTYYLTASGTPDKPIVIKGAGDGEVILDGGGNFNLFNVKTGDYNYIEGITFRNTDIAIWAGTQFQQGSKGLAVKNCRFENVDIGIFSNYSGSSDFYIADNTFIGRDNLNYLTAWTNSPYGQHPAPGHESYWAQFNGVGGQVFPPTMASYVAVKVYGPGHVIAYNYVEGFHDGIDTETYGNPDGSDAIKGPYYPPREYWDKRSVAVDYYNNYMTNFHDNSFEIDGSEHNIRVLRNMMVNSANEPMCNQPAVGGPIYWIRNIIYHAPGGATRMTSGAAGVLFYNNTILTEVNVGSSGNNHWRNNLILGEGASPAIFRELTYTNYSDSDYNGFRVNPGADYSFQWISPPWNVLVDYSSLLKETGAGGEEGGGGRNGAQAGRQPDKSMEVRRYKTLAEYSAATHQDQHSVAVDYDVFVNVPKLEKDPKTVQKLYKASDFDFSLKQGSAAMDKGDRLPNITDGFSGSAPDLGALEYGQTPPHYGPRRYAPGGDQPSGN